MSAATGLNATRVPTRRAFADRMAEYGGIDREFVVFESDIGYSTYSYLFGDKYPERYFNMGIAESNAVSAAAGFAMEGRNVIVCGYGVFITMRAVEAVRSFVCYPDLNVKFLSSHGGLTAAIDGATHQATEDIAFMTTIPNMKVVCPSDPVSARAMFDLALATPGPFFTRLMRDPLFEIYPPGESFELGGSKVLRPGRDITIVSYGDIVFQALEAAEKLAARGIEAEVIDAYSIKPWDIEGISASVRKTGALLVAENHQARNGLGYEIGIHMLKNLPVPFDNLGIPDSFGESGDYLKVIDKYGVSRNQIVPAAERLVAGKS
jgi:transketolase